MKYQLLTLGALCLLCFGCNDDIISESNDEYGFQVSVLAENSSNPLDSVGILHNAISDSIAIQMETAHEDSLYSVIDDYFSYKYGDSLNFANSESIWDTFIEECYIESSNELVYEIFIRDLGINSTEEGQILEVLAIAEEYDGTNRNQIIQSIKDHEADVFQQYANTPGYSITASVLRHSIDYWHPRVSSIRGKFSWKPVFVGLCDAIGAAYGYYEGAGNTTNPYSTVYYTVYKAITISVSAGKLWDMFE